MAPMALLNFHCILGFSNVFRTVVLKIWFHRPGVSAAPENWLKIQILRTCSKPSKSEAVGVRPTNL